ncbi:hypothetical protein [Streptomyces yangpuensis]|uniref:hypothetical protein n=1 Tax=Streptomyces yangpuensis TaxID=1648182 RepID=UPI0012FF0551|nr:hypothetical protein [Streptomyces yangpuensis]
MRTEVQIFAADGPLPDRDSAEDEIDRRCLQLDAITGPSPRRRPTRRPPASDRTTATGRDLRLIVCEPDRTPAHDSGGNGA